MTIYTVDPNQSPTVAFSAAELAVLERLATTQQPWASFQVSS